MLRLMTGQPLVALLQQHLGLFDGLFVLLQTLAQLTKLLVVDAQQLLKAAVIQFRMPCTPVADACAQLPIFSFQGDQALLLGVEFGRQLHPLRAHRLQVLIDRGFGLARLFDRLIQRLLPVFGAAVLAEQLCQLLLADLLLIGERRELLLRRFELLDAGQLPVLFLLQRLLALLLLAEFVALLIELFQALGDPAA